MAEQTKTTGATPESLKRMADAYVEFVRDDRMGPRLQNHMKQTLFEEAIEAHHGPDIWMELNIAQST